MSKTHIDIDDDLLRQVAEITGTSTKREAVEAALRATVRQARRRAAVERLIQRGESGYFDGLLTEHPKPDGHEDVDLPAPDERNQGAA